MAITNDWSVDFVNKIISHVDGVLDYTGVTTGDPPQAGDYVYGVTSTALGKILGTVGQDITDTTSNGTIALTNVQNRFTHAETLETLDSIYFATVTNGGFVVGDTLTTTNGANFSVKAIEYHYTQALQTANSAGNVHGRQGQTTFADAEIIQKSGTQVAVVSGAEVPGDAWTGSVVNEASGGTISPPSSDISAIINFDGGTEAIPRFATIRSTDNFSAGKSAVVQRVYGVTLTGSLKLVDTDDTWANNDEIYVLKIPYDNLQSGVTFKIGDKLITRTSGGTNTHATGKIITVDTTNSKLTVQGLTAGQSLFDNDAIVIRTTSDTYAADINAPNAASDFLDKVADVNGSPIVEQLLSQGGIYNGGSLNIVRDSNALYTYLQDTFDELGALDDDVPMTAQVALQQFTLVNGWKIPDLSFRFIESGSIQDSGLDNIWTNYQTLGSVEGIGNTVYAATTPLPQFYIEQNGSVIDTFWLTGHIDALVKVKTNTDTSKTVSSTGALINSGTVTIFNRNYGDTYDHFETTTIAGVAPIPLATASDLNNTTGTSRLNYDAGGAYTSGEEIRTTNASKRGIITAVSGTSTGTLDYILLTPSTNFADNDHIVGQISTQVSSVNGSPSNLVAGYGSRIIVATVEGTFTYSDRTTNFIDGEQITGGTSSASGIFMADDGASVITVGNITQSTAFASGESVTGATSGATATFTATITVATQIQRDIQDGNGNQHYNAVVYLNRDNQADGDTLARMYEWVKYRTRSLERTGEPAYSLLGGKGSESGKQGRLYITQDTAFALVKASPLGTFAGGTFFGARGVFVEDMATADVRAFQLIDSNGTVRNPPNQQTLQVTGLVSGDRVAVFRTSGGNILTTEFKISNAINTTVNSSISTLIEVSQNTRTASPLPSDTGLYLSFAYSAVDRNSNRFTLTSGDIGDTTGGLNLSTGDNAFVVLIEQQATTTSVSNTIVYVSDIPILSRVRRKGILPFEVAGTFTSSGASVAAIRTFDSIVD